MPAGLFHGFKGVEVNCSQPLKLGFRALHRALAAKPDGDVEAAICRLKGDLAAEYSTAGYGNVLMFMVLSPFEEMLRKRRVVAVPLLIKKCDNCCHHSQKEEG